MRRLLKEKVSISIVIPTRGDKKRIWGIETDLIENVVKSLFDKTPMEDFEVVIVHDVNASYNEHVKSLEHYGKRVKIVPYEKPFNFSEKCNVGVLHSSAQAVVFLNDDIEVIDSWWLNHLAGYLELPEVGAVGPVLLLDNGMVQTAGHVNQPLPANYHSGKPFGVKSFPEPLNIPCEVSGLTAACLAVRRDVFDEVGGFCEDLPNNFNDVDFCLKIQETGRSLIWTPLARLYHFETTTRSTGASEEETQFIKDRWGRTFGVDLYRSRID
jgi:GT2 family glycosyltransferase